MAQGTFPMEYITSAKFRVFLAEKAVNYLYIANVGANVLLTDTNIGCPNISFGPSNFPSSLVQIFPIPCEDMFIVGCEFYEYMASRTLEKIIRLFEGGQAAILGDTVVEEEPEPDDELDALGNWDDLKEKMESGDIERLLEVGIGAGEDDSEWFRHK